jgi:pyridoxine kinase
MKSGMAILSVQSRVTSGYVGNAAATPLLQRLGYTAWPIDTVTFSNHPAHGPYRGKLTPANDVTDLIDGLDGRGLLADCDALLSGYLGSAAMGPVVLETARRIRHANAAAVWICDPVMGDNGEFYVANGIPKFFRDRALPAADILLPNAFEASYLSGIQIGSEATAIDAVGIIMKKGPGTVIITGLRDGSTVSAIAATATGIWRCTSPAIDIPASGAGDVFAALFTGHYLRSREIATALSQAVSGVHAILSVTEEAGSIDLNLVGGLPKLDNPEIFPAESVG